MKQLEVAFSIVLPEFRKNIPYLKVPRLLPFVLLRATCSWRYVRC